MQYRMTIRSIMQIDAKRNFKGGKIPYNKPLQILPLWSKMERVHKDKLREFVARSSGSKGEGLLTEMNKLMDYLFEHNLAYRTTVRCSVVGVHPQNRDGMGVSCHHVAELTKSIHALGVRPKQSQHASGRDVARHPRNCKGDTVQWQDGYGIQWPSPISCMWWPFAVLHNTRFTYQYGVQVAPLWCCQWWSSFDRLIRQIIDRPHWKPVGSSHQEWHGMHSFDQRCCHSQPWHHQFAAGFGQCSPANQQGGRWGLS